MAKVTGPLGSITARGTLGKAITYSTKWGLKLVRAFHKPTGLPSSNQLTQRTSFKSIIAEWSALTDAERVGWGVIDYLLPPLSGYNIFLGRSDLKRKVHQFGSAKFGEAIFGEPGL